MRLVGFSLAGLVTLLIVAGQIIFLIGAIRSGALGSNVSSSTIPGHGNTYHRLQVTLAGALGPSDRSVHRFTVLRVLPDRANRRLADADVVWAINDDLSTGTIGNQAQAEAYAMIRNVFTANLPIASLELQGTFDVLGPNARKHESVVMKLSIVRSVALAVTHAGWDGMEPGSLWPMLHRTYVDPRFEPIAPE